MKPRGNLQNDSRSSGYLAALRAAYCTGDIHALRRVLITRVLVALQGVVPPEDAKSNNRMALEAGIAHVRSGGSYGFVFLITRLLRGGSGATTHTRGRPLIRFAQPTPIDGCTSVHEDHAALVRRLRRRYDDLFS